MKKSSSILFAAGLALTGCSSEPIDKCKNITSQSEIQGLVLGVRGRVENYTENKCTDLKNEAAKTHCEKLIRSLRQQMMSACVTRQTGKPMDCKLTDDGWSCNQINK